MTGIPIFTTHFDDNLYFNGRVTVRNRLMAIATKLNFGSTATQTLNPKRGHFSNDRFQ